MRFAYGDMRDHIVSHKNDYGAFVSALRGIAVAESAKNQLLRDFRCRSILDFCNKRCPSFRVDPNNPCNINGFRQISGVLFRQDDAAGTARSTQCTTFQQVEQIET
jgi:hypothetical protein